MDSSKASPSMTLADLEDQPLSAVLAFLREYKSRPVAQIDWEFVHDVSALIQRKRQQANRKVIYRDWIPERMFSY